MEGSHWNSPCSIPEKWPQARLQCCHVNIDAMALRSGHDRSEFSIQVALIQMVMLTTLAKALRSARKQHSMSMINLFDFVGSNQVVSRSALHSIARRRYRRHNNQQTPLWRWNGWRWLDCKQEAQPGHPKSVHLISSTSEQ